MRRSRLGLLFFLLAGLVWSAAAQSGEVFLDAKISEVSVSNAGTESILSIKVDRDISSHFLDGCNLSDQERVLLIKSSSLSENGWRLMYSAAMVALARKFEVSLKVDGCVHYQSGEYAREVLGMTLHAL